MNGLFLLVARLLQLREADIASHHLTISGERHFLIANVKFFFKLEEC